MAKTIWVKVDLAKATWVKVHLGKAIWVKLDLAKSSCIGYREAYGGAYGMLSSDAHHLPMGERNILF